MEGCRNVYIAYGFISHLEHVCLNYFWDDNILTFEIEVFTKKCFFCVVQWWHWAAAVRSVENKTENKGQKTNRDKRKIVFLLFVANLWFWFCLFVYETITMLRIWAQCSVSRALPAGLEWPLITQTRASGVVFFELCVWQCQYTPVSVSQIMIFGLCCICNSEICKKNIML